MLAHKKTNFWKTISKERAIDKKERAYVEQKSVGKTEENRGQNNNNPQSPPFLSGYVSPQSDLLRSSEK